MLSENDDLRILYEKTIDLELKAAKAQVHFDTI